MEYKKIDLTRAIFNILAEEAEEQTLFFIKQTSNYIYIRGEAQPDLIMLETDKNNPFVDGFAQYDDSDNLLMNYEELVEVLEMIVNEEIYMYHKDKQRYLKFLIKPFDPEIEAGSLEDWDNSTVYTIQVSVRLERFLKTEIAMGDE